MIKEFLVYNGTIKFLGWDILFSILGYAPPCYLFLFLLPHIPLIRYVFLKAQKRKLGLLEDDDMPNLEDTISNKRQNFGEEQYNFDSTSVGKIRGVLKDYTFLHNLVPGF